MVKPRRRRGFTLVELLVVIAIIGILIGMLVPAVNVVRQTAQRTACMSNMKQLGLALQNFQNTYGRYPPSCVYGRGPSNQKYESWSWLTLLLPFVDQKTLFDTYITVNGGVPWLEPRTDREYHKTARETPITIYLCPSTRAGRDYNGKILKGYLGRASGDFKGALTSYKGMGDSQKEGIPFKLPGHGQTAPYPGSHPDGCMFPGTIDDGIRLSDITDSQSQTIMAVETVEDKYARWIVGTEATLAGLPSQNDPAKSGTTLVYNSRLGYYTPQGFDGGFKNDSKLSTNLKTYLNYDYKPQANKYDPQNDIKYGPSSMHTGQVNHLFCDGVVRPINTDVDVAAYMFMITRAGNEQFGSMADELFKGKD